MTNLIFVCDIPDFDYGISENGDVYSYRHARFVTPYVNTNGYIRVRLTREGRQIPMYLHRLLALTFIPNKNTKECLYVDHADRDKQNNSLSNLRWCTLSENNRNKSKREGASSKFLGVSWNKQYNKWESRILVEDNHLSLGSFDDEHKAAEAYRTASKKYFGEFASRSEFGN